MTPECPVGGKPPGSSRPGEDRRRFFVYRVGAFFLFLLVFMIVAVTRALIELSRQAGMPVPPAAIAVATVVGALLVAALFFRGMRGFGFPLGDIFAAAERVGSGDFSPRLIERGPPLLRAIARAFNTMTSRLEAHEKQRRDLMADVAHELRTPLAIMRGRLEGLVDGVYARDDAALLQLVDETRHLERLVEDLRTLAHAEGGTLTLQREITDLAVLIQDVVRSFGAHARAARVTVAVAIDGDLPLVEIDPIRIREVLWNLIANALRHTPPDGRVTVSARERPADIEVAVADTGSGIAPDELPRIFDRFSKGVDSAGSGLGLAIARNLVVAHAGTIRAQSKQGEGTTMTFTLPT